MSTQLITQYSELELSVPQPLDQNPAMVYLAGLGGENITEGSKRVQYNALCKIAEIATGKPDVLSCNWGALRFQHTTAIRSALASYPPASANRMLAALRGTLKAAWRLSQISSDEYQRAIDLKNFIGETVPAGRELSSGEIRALMEVCELDPSIAGTRDAAIIGVLYVGGLRRAELIGADLKDYDPSTGKLVVLGKRHKQRNIYILNGASRALTDWLKIRGTTPGALFFPITRSGKILHRRLTTQAVFNMLKKRAAQAGIASCSPHDLRRTFVSDLLEAGEDISIVAKLAGHASTNVTARYDRRPESAKMQAIKKLHLPYREHKP